MNNYDLFAFCVHDAGQCFVEKGRTYKVVHLEDSEQYQPFGVVIDFHPERTFFMQRFSFFQHSLN